MNLIRLPKVMKKSGLARSTVWLWVKEGKFPAPIKLSPRISAWKEEEVDEWIQDQILGSK